MRTFLLIVLIFGIVIPAVVAASWAVTQTMIEQTSGEAFCTSCHTMEPMGKAYGQDIHGGNNGNGTVAECTGCHLPHGNAVVYLFEKGKRGLLDVWAQNTDESTGTPCASAASSMCSIRAACTAMRIWSAARWPVTRPSSHTSRIFLVRPARNV